MGIRRTVEPAVVRQRLERLAAPPVPVDDDEPWADPEPDAGEDRRDDGGAAEPPGVGISTPRWLDPPDGPVPAVVSPPTPSVSPISLTAMVASTAASRRRMAGRWAAPSADPGTAGGSSPGRRRVLATLVAAFFALRAPSDTVPVVAFPPSAGPTVPGSAAPTSVDRPVPQRGVGWTGGARADRRQRGRPRPPPRSGPATAAVAGRRGSGRRGWADIGRRYGLTQPRATTSRR